MNFTEFKAKYQKLPVTEYYNTVVPNPVVSVCIQTYNHAQYIEECLLGILSQKTTFPYEILLGEDNSTDETRDICLKYAQKYPDKIRLFLHHSENKIKVDGNITGRFNYMYNLYSSKGDFIALCDGDDYWVDNNKLELQYNALMKQKDIHLATHPSYKVVDSSKIRKGLAGFHGDSNRVLSAHEIISSNAAACPSQAIFFRKSVLKRLNEYFIHSPGVHTHIQNLSAIENGAIYMCEPMACYRIETSSSVIRIHKNNKNGYATWLLSTNKVLYSFKNDFPDFNKSFISAINRNLFSIIKSNRTTFKQKLLAVSKAIYPQFIYLILNRIKNKIT